MYHFCNLCKCLEYVEIFIKLLVILGFYFIKWIIEGLEKHVKIQISLY